MPDVPGASDRRLPIYQRLRDDFTARIVRGEWHPGVPIPPEARLSAEYGVALGTVRKAITGLVDEGVLARRQGRGTFVRKVDFTNSLFRFFRHTLADAPERPVGRLLSRRAGKAGRRVADALAIDADDKVLWLARLRLLHGRPLVVDDIALPLPRFNALVDVATDAFSGLLYPLYERETGQIVARAAEHISFGHADAMTARRLGIGPGDPVVCIERIALGYDGTPLEWRRSFGPAKQFSYDIEIR
jgi:GntR family transcriptional regulator